MRKFTFRQLAASGLVCLSLCSLQPAVAAPSVQAGFSPEGSALQLILNTVNSAENNIRLMGYSFTSPEVVTFILPAGVTAAGGIVRSSRVQVTTNGSGVAALDLVSLTPGTYPLQASVGSSPAVSTTTTFYENNGGGPEGILNLEMTVPVDDAPADGQSPNKVQVVVKDRSGTLQANQDVHFSVTPGAVLSATDVKTDGNGLAQVTLTSTTAASYTVTASAGGGTRTVPVTFTTVVLQGTLAASPDAYTVGAHINSALTLTLTDQSGRPLPGRVVTFRGNSVVLDFSSVTDHGNGTYTAQVTTVPAIASPASLVITAMVDGQPLPGAGAQATLTVTGAPQPQFTLSANTQNNPFTYAANSGFPTTGFAGATFTVTGLPAGTTAGDYSWSVQTPGGAGISWLTVDPAGVVTFVSQPSSAEKAVEIIATPKAGGQPVGYRFTLGAWFINGGPEGVIWSTANDWCISEGSSLATVPQLNGSGNGGPYERGLGGLWNEWGDITKYSGSGVTVNTYAWSSDSTPITSTPTGGHYSVNVIDGSVSGSEDAYDPFKYTTCRHSL